MDRRLIIIILLNLFFIQFSRAQFHISEKKVKKNKISKEIIDYVEKNYSGLSTKYYKLRTDQDSICYEAKVKTDQGKINLIFDRSGQFISIDKEIDYRDISEETRSVINNYFDIKYTKYKVTHSRDHKLENEQVYELDVSAKKKKYRFRFKKDGTLIEYKEIPQKKIDLIFN